MSLPSWCVPGTEIICINATWLAAFGSSPLHDKAKYTISGIADAKYVFDTTGRRFDRRQSILLREVDNPTEPKNGFDPLRFRPVIQKRAKRAIRIEETA